MSLQKSGRGTKSSKPSKPTKPAKKGGGRNAAPGARQVYVQTAKNDVFTYLLAVSLGAIFIGVIFLVLILNRYEFKTKVAGTAPAASTAPLLA